MRLHGEDWWNDVGTFFLYLLAKATTFELPSVHSVLKFVIGPLGSTVLRFEFLKSSSHCVLWAIDHVERLFGMPQIRCRTLYLSLHFWRRRKSEWMGIGDYSIWHQNPSRTIRKYHKPCLSAIRLTEPLESASLAQLGILLKYLWKLSFKYAYTSVSLSNPPPLMDDLLLTWILKKRIKGKATWLGHQRGDANQVETSTESI